MPTTEFRTLVAVARRRADMAPAQFDYSLAFGVHARAAFASAAYTLATEGLPVVDTATPAEEVDRRIELGHGLLAEHQDAIETMAADAKAKTYTGWSAASSGGIRYAEGAR